MENYKYPTNEEWLKVSRTFPEMGGFGFSFIKDITLLLGGEKSIKEVHQIQNLYHWDLVLNTKIWNLRQSYVNTLVNFNRGIAQTDQEFKSEEKVIHLNQFEFYFETTMYYLISARDVILQIINLAFIEKFSSEFDVRWGTSVISKIEDLKIKDILITASNNLKEINDLRNSMAHRFPKTTNDFRSSISEDGKRYGSFKRKAIDYDKRVDKLKTGIENLYSFYTELKLELGKKFPLEKPYSSAM
ncbi:Cthe_2314 family HEPN domain-containing protein [Algoriphagus resistens]|uniref:Cthe_2314 family HEPN domain-containing protein n=1 Tax=Algoriphagus resistens TaxID=1750590 RepID=UPI000716AE23|nr:Cthe_2314 family HEPN domain-containing protein [Algoriphagus resistens]